MPYNSQAVPFHLTGWDCFGILDQKLYEVTGVKRLQVNDLSEQVGQ